MLLAAILGPPWAIVGMVGFRDGLCQLDEGLKRNPGLKIAVKVFTCSFIFYWVWFFIQKKIIAQLEGQATTSGTTRLAILLDPHHHHHRTTTTVPGTPLA